MADSIRDILASLIGAPPSVPSTKYGLPASEDQARQDDMDYRFRERKLGSGEYDPSIFRGVESPRRSEADRIKSDSHLRYSLNQGYPIDAKRLSPILKDGESGSFDAAVNSVYVNQDAKQRLAAENRSWMGYPGPSAYRYPQRPQLKSEMLDDQRRVIEAIRKAGLTPQDPDAVELIKKGL